MIVLNASQGGDYAMRYYNSDGTLGEMCGNGARCIARFGHDRGLAGDIQRIETTAGWWSDSASTRSFTACA
jgi:diaminopimelate epimerase